MVLLVDDVADGNGEDGCSKGVAGWSDAERRGAGSREPCALVAELAARYITKAGWWRRRRSAPRPQEVAREFHLPLLPPSFAHRGLTRRPEQRPALVAGAGAGARHAANDDAENVVFAAFGVLGFLQQNLEIGRAHV